MNKKVHTVDSVFMLLVFTIFAVASLALVIIGAGVYRGVVKGSDANNETRASLAYVTNQVRAHDTKDGVKLEQINGVDVLTMPTEFMGGRYINYLYYYDGQIKEQYLNEEMPLELEKGQVVAQVEQFSMEQQGNTLTFRVTDSEQNTMSMRVTLRSA